MAGSNRNFGFVMGAALVVVGLWPIFSGSGPRLWALVVSAAFVLLAAVAPNALGLLNKLWFRLGLILHKLVSPVILGILFFLVLLPTALGLRFMRKDLLRLRWDAEASSYWIPRDPPGPKPETMIHQF